MAKATRKEIFETLPVPQAVRKMIIPTIFGQIIVLIYNMADTFFLEKTSDPSMPPMYYAEGTHPAIIDDD